MMPSKWVSNSFPNQSRWADDYYALYDEYQTEIRKRNEKIRNLEDEVWKAKEKHSLKEPDESEITDTVEYGSDIDDFECPSCGSGLYIK